jgi:hypothetical protein
MIPKSVQRFSEKIMLKTRSWSGMTIQAKVIPLWPAAEKGEPSARPAGAARR